MTYLEFLASVEIDNNSLLHKHHIIPRSEGGDDSKENLIMLTPAQHAFAHILYDRENGTKTATMFLQKLGLHKKSIDEITYEDCLAYNDCEAARTKAVSKAHKGVPQSDETKKKRSKALKGVPKSEEAKQNMRKPKSTRRKSEKRTNCSGNNVHMNIGTTIL